MVFVQNVQAVLDLMLMEHVNFVPPLFSPQCFLRAIYLSVPLDLQVQVQVQPMGAQHVLHAQMVTVQQGLQNQMVGAHYVLMIHQHGLRGKCLDYAQHALLDLTVGSHKDQICAQHALLQV